LKPGRAAAAGRDTRVTVSPTFAAWISLMPAMMKPTSPADSDSRPTAFGVKTPTCSQLNVAAAAIRRILSRGFRVPCITRTSITTPT